MGKMPAGYKELFAPGFIKEITVSTTGWPAEDGEVLLRDGTTDFTAHEPNLIVDGPGVPPAADILIIRDLQYNYVVPYGNLLFLTCRFKIKKTGLTEFRTLFNVQTEDYYYAGQLYQKPRGPQVRKHILEEIDAIFNEFGGRENLPENTKEPKTPVSRNSGIPEEHHDE